MESKGDGLTGKRVENREERNGFWRALEISENSPSLWPVPCPLPIGPRASRARAFLAWPWRNLQRAAKGRHTLDGPWLRCEWLAAPPARWMTARLPAGLSLPLPPFPIGASQLRAQDWIDAMSMPGVAVLQESQASSSLGTCRAPWEDGRCSGSATSGMAVRQVLAGLASDENPGHRPPGREAGGGRWMVTKVRSH
jgi:hypothetical protein